MERESIHISVQISQCSVAAVAAKIQEETDSEEGYSEYPGNGNQGFIIHKRQVETTDKVTTPNPPS